MAALRKNRGNSETFDCLIQCEVLILENEKERNFFRNSKFWDFCSANSIRKKVAEFIDSNPNLTQFKSEKYFELEDSLVEFIEQNRNLIYRETEQEFFREDVYHKLVENCEENADLFMKLLSIENLDCLIDTWQEELNDYDRFWESFWEPLIKILEKCGLLSDFSTYKQKEIQLYAVYLNDWLNNHDFEEMSPACIGEFLSNEMQNADTAEYYKNLLKKKSETNQDAE